MTGLGLQARDGQPTRGKNMLLPWLLPGWAAVPRPYVVVSGENDKSQPKEPSSAGAGAGAGSLAFQGAKFVFIVLFSSSSFEISLKGRKGPAKLNIAKVSKCQAYMLLALRWVFLHLLCYCPPAANRP